MDMKNKFIATIVKATIDLKLLVGYKLITLDDWNKLDSQLSEGEVAALRQEILDWQGSAYQLNRRIQDLTTEKEKLEKKLHDTTSKLTDSINEVEIANSEMLVLRDSLEEGTALSKQLKEALDRWTS